MDAGLIVWKLGSTQTEIELATSEEGLSIGAVSVEVIGGSRFESGIRAADGRGV